jgi:hypothetical protein
VKLVRSREGELLEKPLLVNTWERDDRGRQARAVLEAVDPDAAGFDPLAFVGSPAA